MSKPYKYEIAISFAEEDVDLAEQLHKTLESYVFKYKTYFYKKEQGEQVGKKLHKIIQEVYGGESEYVIVLVSKFYDQKEWTQREWEVIEDEREKRQGLYRVLISIDGTILNGMDRKELHIPNDNSAERIAMIIHEVIHRDRKEPPEGNGPQPKKKYPEVILRFLLKVLGSVTVKVTVTVIAASILTLMTIGPEKVIVDSIPPFIHIRNPTKPIPDTKTTDLILTRSEQYADMNIYVNDEKVAVFREYTITIPSLKLGSEIEIGTDTHKEFILKINQTHLQNESFEHFIE